MAETFPPGDDPTKKSAANATDSTESDAQKDIDQILEDSKTELPSMAPGHERETAISAAWKKAAEAPRKKNEPRPRSLSAGVVEPEGEKPEEQKEGIAFVITRDMKQQLADLGWARKERENLTPEQIHQIIEKGERPVRPTEEKPVSKEEKESKRQEKPKKKASPRVPGPTNTPLEQATEAAWATLEAKYHGNKIPKKLQKEFNQAILAADRASGSEMEAALARVRAIGAEEPVVPKTPKAKGRLTADSFKGTLKDLYQQVPEDTTEENLVSREELTPKQQHDKLGHLVAALVDWSRANEIMDSTPAPMKGQMAEKLIADQKLRDEWNALPATEKAKLAQEKATVQEKAAAESIGAGLKAVGERETLKTPEAEEIAKFLDEREAKIDAKADRIGFGQYVRQMGASYNKLKTWQKIAIGGSLAAGSIGSLWFAPAAAGVFATGITLQRFIGGTGMFVKFEKHLQEVNEGKLTGGRVGKKLATLDWYKKLASGPDWKRTMVASGEAVLYSLAFSKLIGEAVQLSGPNSYGGELVEWLKHHWSSSSTPAENATAPAASGYQSTLGQATIGNADPVEIRLEHPGGGMATIVEGNRYVSVGQGFPLPNVPAEAAPPVSPPVEHAADHSLQQLHNLRAKLGLAPHHPQMPTTTPTEAPTPTPVTKSPEAIHAPAPLAGPGHTQPAPAESVASNTPPPSVSYEHAQSFFNTHRLPINPLEGHVFADAQGNSYAYGNDFNQRLLAAESFVRANHGAEVWVQAKDPTFVNGEWRPWVFQVKYGGVFRGVQVLIPNGPPDPAQVGAIRPDTFIKQLD